MRSACWLVIAIDLLLAGSKKSVNMRARATVSVEILVAVGLFSKPMPRILELQHFVGGAERTLLVTATVTFTVMLYCPVALFDHRSELEIGVYGVRISKPFSWRFPTARTSVDILIHSTHNKRAHKNGNSETLFVTPSSVVINTTAARYLDTQQ